MNSIPQLNDVMPDFNSMKPLNKKVVIENLVAYLVKRMIDVSGYIVLILITGYIALKVAEKTIN